MARGSGTAPKLGTIIDKLKISHYKELSSLTNDSAMSSSINKSFDEENPKEFANNKLQSDLPSFFVVDTQKQSVDTNNLISKQQF